MQPAIDKVTALITRTTPQGTDLLLFEHPLAGYQLPAGTVEPGEPHAVAAAREALEETGLADLPPGRWLASRSEPLPEDGYLTAVTTTVYSRPDLGSFDWARIRYGILVRKHSEQAGFAQVTYTEHDWGADPPALMFQITGWVPADTITRQVTRHFYRFDYHGQTPPTWLVDTDYHRFRLFWAPLAALPALQSSQQWWVTVLDGQSSIDGNTGSW